MTKNGISYYNQIPVMDIILIVFIMFTQNFKFHYHKRTALLFLLILTNKKLFKKREPYLVNIFNLQPYQFFLFVSLFFLL